MAQVAGVGWGLIIEVQVSEEEEVLEPDQFDDMVPVQVSEVV